jgi:hypothetical protein
MIVILFWPDLIPPLVEPHGLKSLAPPHASKGGTLRSIPHYAPNELRGVTPLAFIHGLKVRGFLRRRVKETMGGFKKGYSFSLTISTKLFIKIGGLIKRVGSSNPSVGSIKQSKG